MLSSLFHVTPIPSSRCVNVQLLSLFAFFFLRHPLSLLPLQVLFITITILFFLVFLILLPHPLLTLSLFSPCVMFCCYILLLSKSFSPFSHSPLLIVLFFPALFHVSLYFLFHFFSHCGNLSWRQILHFVFAFIFRHFFFLSSLSLSYTPCALFALLKNSFCLFFSFPSSILSIHLSTLLAFFVFVLFFVSLFLPSFLLSSLS